LGAVVIAVVNGIARRALYEQRLGPMAALVGLLGDYLWLLAGCWPIATRRTALLIGGTWAMLTVVFEFGLGHYVNGEAWSKLLEQYDLRRGYVWVLIPLWTAVGPAVMRALRSSPEQY
jgi:hypothetical protein